MFLITYMYTGVCMYAICIQLRMHDYLCACVFSCFYMQPMFIWKHLFTYACITKVNMYACLWIFE